MQETKRERNIRLFYTRKRYECPDCAEQFKYKYNYSLHIKNNHTSHKQTEAARRFL
jgi:transposase-like protein